jgi:hypothetical protein
VDLLRTAESTLPFKGITVALFGPVVVLSPFASAGALLGTARLVPLMREPLLVLDVTLIIGLVTLAFVTSGFREFEFIRHSRHEWPWSHRRELRDGRRVTGYAAVAQRAVQVCTCCTRR